MENVTDHSSQEPSNVTSNAGHRTSGRRRLLMKWSLLVVVLLALSAVFSRYWNCETRVVSSQDVPLALFPLRTDNYPYQPDYGPDTDLPLFKHGLSERQLRVLTSPDEVYVLQTSPESVTPMETVFQFHGHKIGSWKRVSNRRTCAALGQSFLKVIDSSNTLFFWEVPWLYHGIRFRANEEVVDVQVSIPDRFAMVYDKDEVRYVNLDKHASYYWLTSQFCWQHPFGPGRDQ